MLIVLVGSGWRPRQTRGLEAYIEVEIRKLWPACPRPAGGRLIGVEPAWFGF